MGDPGRIDSSSTLKANGCNAVVQLLERVVLPRLIGHARDLAHVSFSEWAVTSMMLAFHEIPSKPAKSQTQIDEYL